MIFTLVPSGDSIGVGKYYLFYGLINTPHFIGCSVKTRVFNCFAAGRRSRRSTRATKYAYITRVRTVT